MSLQETKSQVSAIISAYSSYCSSISSVKADLSLISDKVNSVGSAMGECIESSAILNYSDGMVNNITSSLSKCMSTIEETKTKLRDDAGKKIRELIDSYNSYNSRLPEEDREPYLSYGDFMI